MCGMAMLAEDTLDIELDGRAGGNEGTCNSRTRSDGAAHI